MEKLIKMPKSSIVGEVGGNLPGAEDKRRVWIWGVLGVIRAGGQHCAGTQAAWGKAVPRWAPSRVLEIRTPIFF